MIIPKIVMPRFLFFFLILLTSISTFGQTNSLLDSLINDDLVKIINSTQEFYTMLWKGKKTIANDYCIYTDNYYKNFEYSKEVISTGIKFISANNLSEEQQRKGVFGISFTGAVLDNNKLELRFVEEGYKLEGKKLVCGMADGYSFYYEYSCDLNKWFLVKTDPVEILKGKPK